MPGVLSTSPNSDYPFAINSSGQLTGSIGNVAFFYNGTTSVSLGTLGGNQSCFYAVNDNGLSVGCSQPPPNAVTPVLAYAAAGGTIQQVGDGTLDGAFYGINSAGTGVGMLGGSASAGNLTILTRYNYLGQAFVDTWNGSSYGATPTVLPSLVAGDTTTNAACAISDGGIAVGRSNSHAVIYTQSGGNWTTTNLNTTSLVTNLDGWSLTSAEDISHNGDYIVGYGTILGAQHAFLLAATPEPSTLLLATAGLAGLLAYAWRKRK